MSLTDRALRYLASLERRPAISTERLQRTIKNQGVEPFDAWLDFQERYAGYVQPLGRDQAIWGLTFEESSWLPAQDVVLEERVRNFWFAVCADVHPSYSYWLNSDGEITVGPAETFDIFVERLAIQWTFCGERSRTPFLDYSVKDPSIIEHLQNQAQVVEEASDDYRTYRLSAEQLGIYDHRQKDRIQVFTHAKST